MKDVLTPLVVLELEGGAVATAMRGVPPGWLEARQGRVRASLREWLEELGRAAEVAWLSSGPESVAELEVLLGVAVAPESVLARRSQPVLDELEGPGGASADLVLVEALGAERPLLWAGCALGVDAWRWAEARRTSAPTRLVVTDPREGVSRAQQQMILEWCLFPAKR